MIVIRSKGGFDYGWGHIRRMIALASVLRQRTHEEVHFIVEGNGKVLDFLRSSGFTVHEIPFGLDAVTERQLWPLQNTVSLMFVDMLEIEPVREKYLKEMTQRLIVFDDINCRSHHADIVLCPQTFDWPEIERHNGQTSLRGPKYFVLSEEFRETVDMPKETASQPKELLVSLGGSCPADLLIKVASALQLLRTVFDRIVFIAGFESNASVMAELRKLLPEADLIHSTNNMHRLLFEADIALIAGGFLKYEAAASGTPALIVSIVDHQHDLSTVFSKKGTADYIGRLQHILEADIRSALISLAEDHERRKKMSIAGRSLIDGKAAVRIIDFCLASCEQGE